VTIAGYIEYQRREFCNDIECSVQMLLNRQQAGSAEYEAIRGICQTACIHSTYEFHHWLIEKDYLLIRPTEEE
jgi:hypothetical protein